MGVLNIQLEIYFFSMKSIERNVSDKLDGKGEGNGQEV